MAMYAEEDIRRAVDPTGRFAATRLLPMLAQIAEERANALESCARLREELNAPNELPPGECLGPEWRIRT
jgi:hypothetical protein